MLTTWSRIVHPCLTGAERCVRLAERLDRKLAPIARRLEERRLRHEILAIGAIGD